MMQLDTSELLAGAAIAIFPAVLLWGLVSARMQARPWRMMAVAALVVGPVTIFQLMLSSQSAHPSSNAEFNSFYEKFRLFELAWMSVALGIGGALFGAAIAARATQLHAEEVRRLDRAKASNLKELLRTEKELAALKASAAPDSEDVLRSIRSAHRRLAHLAGMEADIEKKRTRLGFDE